MKFTLFLPTYNVEKSVHQVLAGIPDRVVREAERILCIDNQSTDGTVAKICEFASGHPHRDKFTVLLNRENYLLGGSTIIAIRQAQALGCDYLLNLHSDGQADARDLEAILDRCDATSQCIVLGSRFLMNSAAADYSFARKTGNWFFIYLQQLLLSQKVYDLGALMALPLARVREIDFQRIPHDMGYQPLLLMEIIRVFKNVPVYEVPISWGAVETSNVNPWAYGLTHLYRCLTGFAKHTFVTLNAPPQLESDLISL